MPKEIPWTVCTWYLQELFEGGFRRAIECLAFSPGDWILLKMNAMPKPLLAAVAYDFLREYPRFSEIVEAGE